MRQVSAPSEASAQVRRRERAGGSAQVRARRCAGGSAQVRRAAPRSPRGTLARDRRVFQRPRRNSARSLSSGGRVSTRLWAKKKKKKTLFTSTRIARIMFCGDIKANFQIRFFSEARSYEAQRRQPASGAVALGSSGRAGGDPSVVSESAARCSSLVRPSACVGPFRRRRMP